MIHTYYIKFYPYNDNDYGLIGLITKAENKKEALVKLNSHFPSLRLKEYDLIKLDKLEVLPFYQ